MLGLDGQPLPVVESRQHYLFVLTRSLEHSSSARYLLRQAASLLTQNCEVTLVLMGDAAGAPAPALSLTAARVCLCGPRSPRRPRNSEDSTVEHFDSAELAALMLEPGIQTCWC